MLRTMRKPHLLVSAGKISLYSVTKALEATRKWEEVKHLVPPEYHAFSSMFDKAVAVTSLLPRPLYDHNMPLRPDFTPPFGPLYSCSREELLALKQWLEENLSTGFIRASSSPAAAPILFVKKKDGKLRVCVDYRKLNKGTIKNRYPLPLLKETLEWLSHAKYFTTLDIRVGYNNIRMAEGEEWKTVFRI